MANDHRQANGLEVEAAPLWPNYVSGLAAGVVNVTATFPINKVIYRQQIESAKFPVAFKQVTDFDKIITSVKSLSVDFG